MIQDPASELTVFVDARCLQNDRFRERGIGHHASSLLAGAHQFAPKGCSPKLIACVDRSMPPLRAEHRAIFAAEEPVNAIGTSGSIFLQLSPMTYSPHPLQSILGRSDMKSVAVVYDFIPLQRPTLYLSNSEDRQRYLECLAALCDYDHFVAISDFTARVLQGTLDLSPNRCTVSGVAVRDSVICQGESSPQEERHFLVVGGDDDRKNVELPIIAHARSTVFQEFGITLKIVGDYSEQSLERLRSLHLREGGASDLLQFSANINDEELALLYQNALVTICPSRAEGFSIPVVEANANGCPVIVSNCDAQVELMPIRTYQFDPDDDARVLSLMQSFIDPQARQDALNEQGRFWTGFEVQEVQRRFWRTVYENAPAGPAEAEIGSPFVSRGAKPRLAIASPVPPDRTGVADYTMATMVGLAKYADLDLYTETQGRIDNRAFCSIQPLTSAPYVKRRHDGVISVLGNSHFHTTPFKLLLDYGGACIAHDARMLHFYLVLMGEERTAQVASRELGRQVAMEEIHGWCANQRSMPILFLSEILEAATPTFVHSPTTRDIIPKLYGRDAVHLPFAVYREQWPEFIGAEGRVRARDLLGYADDAKLIICLGDLIEDKALEECLWTVCILSSWNVPVRLAFVGNSNPVMVDYLRSTAKLLGIAEKIRFTEGIVSERVYQAYLAAADAAMQFRTYGFGGLSGAMLDGIAIGLPTVANVHLAEAMESPSYVATVSDGLSPILAAEQFLAIFQSEDREQLEEERQEFLQAHSVDSYAKRLLQSLDLG